MAFVSLFCVIWRAFSCGWASCRRLPCLEVPHRRPCLFGEFRAEQWLRIEVDQRPGQPQMPFCVKMSAPSQRESWPCIMSRPVCIATSAAE